MEAWTKWLPFCRQCFLTIAGLCWITWLCKGPGHQQACYWLHSFGMFHCPHSTCSNASVTSNHVLRRCSSRGHIRLRAPYGLTRLYTYGLVEWFIGLHGYPVRCLYGHRAGPARESSMFFISYGTRTGPMLDPQGRSTTPLQKRKGIDTTKIDKSHARASYLAVRGLYGPRMGCSQAVQYIKTRTGPESL